MTNIRLSIVSYARRQRDVETGIILARDPKARNRFRGIASGEDPMKTRQIAHNDYPAARYRFRAQYTTSLVIWKMRRCIVSRDTQMVSQNRTEANDGH